jgi:hypothetical protein
MLRQQKLKGVAFGHSDSRLARLLQGHWKNPSIGGCSAEADEAEDRDDDDDRADDVDNLVHCISFPEWS